MVKYILVTGGVLSGIGKGVIASSTGRLLKSYGFNVTQIKIDPYINVDAGTMSPFEHGEVFVLDDGGEVDLDLGNYERFVDITLTSDNNITTGKIYKSVIERERRGDYLGKTVQVIPHIVNEIQDWVLNVSMRPTDAANNMPDFCVIELGGTVGDIESMPFIEAMRQFQFRVGKENFCCIHVSLVPIIGVVGEQKTKPTQMSVQELRKLGLFPDFICCRSSTPLTDSTKNKISQYCHVPPKNVVGVPDCSNLYSVPLQLHEQGFSNSLLETLKIGDNREPDFKDWIKIINKVDELNNRQNSITIAMVGKYTDLSDAYLSVTKSLNHASTFIDEKVTISWVEASHLEETHPDPEEHVQAWESLKKANGILVPGGFGDRGIEGKILAAKYSRENNIPYFGICLGLQIAVIEYSRNVLGIEDANSEEFNDKTDNKVVVYMPEIDKVNKGGTMRLGKRETKFKDKNSTIYKLYNHILTVGEDLSVYERHRHRYEVNIKYLPALEEKGLKFVGQDTTGQRQEIIELEGHPYFVGVQYHPEFKSRPNKPSPPFVGLLLAASGKLESWKNNQFTIGF